MILECCLVKLTPSSLWLKVSDLREGLILLYGFSSDQVRPIPDNLPFCECKFNYLGALNYECEALSSHSVV